MNGFFSRVATTEVVLEWCQANIKSADDFIDVDVSGVTVAVSETVGFLTGQYTVEGAINAFVEQLNTLPSIVSTGVSFTANPIPGGYVLIEASGGLIRVSPGRLQQRLGLGPLNQYLPSLFISCPDLRPYRYIDFVSSQLTYPQNVKDASTNTRVRDVLCRWYFAWDDPPQLDGYGYPILMGYTRFVVRRIFNPPKYIKWESNLPVGNLAFEVVGPDGDILPIPTMALGTTVNKNNWCMTLQVSEN